MSLYRVSSLDKVMFVTANTGVEALEKFPNATKLQLMSRIIDELKGGDSIFRVKVIEMEAGKDYFIVRNQS